MAAKIQSDAPFVGKTVMDAAMVYPGIKFMPIAIVTGGSKGLGANICIKLAQSKYKVVIVYKSSKSDADKIYKECIKYSEALLIKADVSNKKACEKIIRSVIGPR